MMNLKISIITVCFNSRETIEQTIKSVLEQRYPYIEYIVIDGGSTDGTIDIIRKYESKISCWISEHDNGIYDAMNKGIGRATGDIIGIINSDDWYEPDTFSLVATYFARHDVDWLHGDMFMVKGNRKNLWRGNINRILPHAPWYEHPTVFVRRSIYDKYGRFDTQYDIYSDVEFMLRLFFIGTSIGYIPCPLANFRLDGRSNGFNRSNYYCRIKEHRRIFFDICQKFSISTIVQAEMRGYLVDMRRECLFFYSVWRLASTDKLEFKLKFWLKGHGKEYLAVWGTGEDCRKMIPFFECLTSSLRLFVDASASRQGQYILGTQIRNPREISNTDLTIICSGRYEKEIRKQLLSKGKIDGVDFLSYKNFQCCFISRYAATCLTMI